MPDLPELSELAWGILDTACAPTGYVNWERCAVGQRDALVRAGAVVKQLHVSASPGKMGRGGRAPIYKLAPTDAGRKLLADRKAARTGAESG